MEEAQEQRSRFPDSCSAPWLTFFHGKPKKMSQTFYSLSERRLHVRCIRELRNSRCWPTVLGWMLVQDLWSRQWFLLDPKSMAKIELPQLERNLPTSCSCILSSPPTDPDCMIMCTNFDKQLLFFCRPGFKKWVKHGYNLEGDNLYRAVACNGKFYARTVQNSFAAIDFAPRPGIRILEARIRNTYPVGLNNHDVHMLESSGHVFLVQTFYLNVDKVVYLSVYRMNFSTRSWDMVRCIGDDCVFILGNDRFSVSWPAKKLGVKGNCIYFVKPKDVCMYVFDMEEGTIQTSRPCPNVWKSWSAAIWIVPTLEC